MTSPIPLDQLLDRATSGEAEAQYHLGRHYAARTQMSRAQRWFEQAAQVGHAGAQTELALFALYGVGRPYDLAAAIVGLQEAERAGSAEAAYQLALLELGDIALPYDAQRCMDRLRFAARDGFPSALRALALAYASTSKDDTRQAISDACLSHAAAGGDAISAYLLGCQWLRRGQPASAAPWFALAAQRGVAQATRRLAELPAGASQVLPASLPLGDLPEIELALGAPPVRTVWHESPNVATIEAVLSPLDCDFVIALGGPFLEPSMTVDPRTGKSVRNVLRTSSSMSFSQFQDDFWLRVLQRRMCALAGASLSHGEHLALLRYLPGEEYKPHRDYLHPTVEGEQFAPDRPGQRTRTIFCYLNNVETGGATDFPNLKVRVEPKIGRAVLFDNVHADGSPDPDTLHAGMPVEAGEKWLATLWIRERPARYY